MRRPAFSVLFATAILAACEDGGVLRPDLPAGCDSPRACQVTGVDLVVDAPQFLAAADHARDSVTGRIVFQPDEPLLYSVSVWNRGDTPSDSAVLRVEQAVVVVPALPPGRGFVDTLEIRAPSRVAAHDNAWWLYARLDSLQAMEDPLHGNDRNESDTVFVAWPVLRVSFSVPDTVHAEVGFPATVTVRNESRFADAAPLAMAFCLFDYDVGCGSWAGEPFGLTAVPSIPAGGSWTVDLDITIPDHSPYSPWDWVFLACFAEAGTGLDGLDIFAQPFCAPDYVPITVLDPPTTAWRAPFQ